MRKWQRDRMRRRRPSGQAAPAQPAMEPLQPMTMYSEPETAANPEPAESMPPAEAAPEPGPAEGAPPAKREGEGSGKPGRGRRRRRGGRGRQRPGGAPRPPSQPAATAVPLVPEYPAERFQQSSPQAAENLPEQPAPVAAPRPAAAARPSRGAVVLAIGLPGSGKSNWFKRRGVTPLSSDLLRTLLFDNITEQRYQDLVFSTLRSLLRARLIARMPWNYVDATNLSPRERHGWIKMAREFGYEAHAVFFDVPVEVCMERNRKRARVVPEEVMQRMASRLKAPTFEEGFAKIIVVRVKKQEPEGGEEQE